jgi:anthranilate/para-aminobenzoate synthase component II
MSCVDDAENLEKVSSAAYSGKSSSGSGSSGELGISSVVVDRWTGRFPILGVCLGHQLLATKRSVAVVKGEPVHGRTGTLIHREGLFADLPSPLNVARYHSLRVDTSHWPAELRIMATECP